MFFVSQRFEPDIYESMYLAASYENRPFVFIHVLQAAFSRLDPLFSEPQKATGRTVSCFEDALAGSMSPDLLKRDIKRAEYCVSPRKSLPAVLTSIATDYPKKRDWFLLDSYENIRCR